MAESFDLWFYDRPFDDVLPWAAAYAAYWKSDPPIGRFDHQSGARVPPLKAPVLPELSAAEPATAEDAAQNPHVQRVKKAMGEVFEGNLGKLLPDLSVDAVLQQALGTLNAAMAAGMPSMTVRLIEPMPNAQATLVETSDSMENLAFCDFIGYHADAHLLRIARCEDEATGWLDMATITVRDFDKTVRGLDLWREEGDSLAPEPLQFSETGAPLAWEPPSLAKGPVEERLSMDDLSACLMQFGVDLAKWTDRHFERVVDFSPSGDPNALSSFAAEIQIVDNHVSNLVKRIRDEGA